VKIYISSSWKNRKTVRALASQLKDAGHSVFDFTDQKNRIAKICPPEKFPEQFNPEKHSYREYLDRPEWRSVVNENQYAVECCDLVVLLLPCGIDATADWAYGVGCGKRSIIVGSPVAGERSPVHLWADHMVDTIDEVFDLVP